MTNIDKPKAGASRDQTWLANPPAKRSFFDGKIIHLNMGFSSHV